MKEKLTVFGVLIVISSISFFAYNTVKDNEDPQVKIYETTRLLSELKASVIHYENSKNRKLYDLNELKPEYFTRECIDAWGRTVKLDVRKGTLRSAGFDGHFSGQDDLGDDIVLPYFPMLCLSYAELSVDKNRNRSIDSGDEITIHFNKSPQEPSCTEISGLDFRFYSSHDPQDRSSILATGDRCAKGQETLGKLTALSVKQGTKPGLLSGKSTFVTFKVERDSETPFSGDLYVGFSMEEINGIPAFMKYKDSQGLPAANHRYNIKVIRN